MSILGFPYPCIYRWKPGVATWARDLPKVGFGHQVESNTDSRTKRRGVRRPGARRHGPWRLGLDAMVPGVWACPPRKVTFPPTYDLVDLPTWPSFGCRVLESSITLRILP